MACALTRPLRSFFQNGKALYFSRAILALYTTQKQSHTHSVARERLWRQEKILIQRKFSTESINMTEDETIDHLKEKIDRLSEKFNEARELLEDAMNSKDSVYFNEDMETASEAVEELLREYTDVIKSLSDEHKGSVKKTFDLKLQELRSQRSSIIDSLREL